MPPSPTTSSRRREAAPRRRIDRSRRADAARSKLVTEPRVVGHLRLGRDDHAHVERLARRFRALGDPTRSKLVFALSLGERCVSELAAALGASLSATSHQLRILRDLEIVRVRRAGKSQVYTLNDQAFGFCSPRSCGAWKSALSPVDEESV